MKVFLLIGGALALLAGPAALAQSVGIGTATPAAGAALEIQATDRGLLIPRLLASQRTAIAAPPPGLMVYQTDVPEGFWYFGGAPGVWVYLNPTPAGSFTLPYNGTAATGTGTGLSSAAFGIANPGLGASAGTAIRGDNTNANAQNAIGVWGSAVRGYGVYGSATGNGGYGVQGISTSSVGVNGVSSSGYGVQATSGSNAAVQATTATNALTQAAVVGLNTNAGGAATGLYGETLGGYGVVGKATASGGFGVTGFATDSYGVVANSNSGNAVYAVSASGFGVEALSSANSAISATANTNDVAKAAVVGTNTNANANAIGLLGLTQTGFGVWGKATNGCGVTGTAINGTGIRGIATNSGNGVYGFASSPYSVGVQGVNMAGAGTQALGVLGDTNSQYGAGVYGSGAGGALAGLFVGSVSVTANLNVTGSKNFKIDHPLDPAHQYLYHSCIESPDMMNVYNGNVTLDATGAATVLLPDYFEALNRDFRYQLTPLGSPGPGLYVAEKVRGNRFRIAGGAPGGEVSWQVTGIRQDKAADRYRTVVEVPKEPRNQGRYLLPEAYGQPASQGIGVWQPAEAETETAAVAPASGAAAAAMAAAPAPAPHAVPAAAGPVPARPGPPRPPTTTR